MFGQNPLFVLFPLERERVSRERGFLVAVQRQTDPPDPRRVQAMAPPWVLSEEPATQPDATAGSAEEKKQPDSWHLTLASARLFSHKWPRVPLQRRGCARGMSSMGNELHAPGGGGCLMCLTLPLLTGLPFQPC